MHVSKTVSQVYFSTNTFWMTLNIIMGLKPPILLIVQEKDK